MKAILCDVCEKPASKGLMAVAPYRLNFGHPVNMISIDMCSKCGNSVRDHLKQIKETGKETCQNK